MLRSLLFSEDQQELLHRTLESYGQGGSFLKALQDAMLADPRRSQRRSVSQDRRKSLRRLSFTTGGSGLVSAPSSLISVEQTIRTIAECLDKKSKSDVLADANRKPRMGMLKHLRELLAQQYGKLQMADKAYYDLLIAVS